MSRAAIALSLLFSLPLTARAQTTHTTQTVREAEFRSRWVDYQVDRLREEAVRSGRVPVPPTPEDRGLLGMIARSFDEWFRQGPFVLGGRLGLGWEYSNEQPYYTTNEAFSESSLFAAPALAAYYKREIGPWTVSAGYSAGYLYYFDKQFVGAGGEGAIQSQTGSLSVEMRGKRVELRSLASASYGQGFEIERGALTNRFSVNEALTAAYQLTEFARLGAAVNFNYSRYSDTGTGTGRSDEALSNLMATVYGEHFWTGKTRLRAEISAGQDSQISGDTDSLERRYCQALLRVNYQPSFKLACDVGVGVRWREETDVGRSESELRPAFSVRVHYAPTEKTSVSLYGGYEGTDVQPSFSLDLRWRPRETTSVNLSVYQRSDFSSFHVGQDRVSRGILASVQQRLFRRIELTLSAGWEQAEYQTGDSAVTVSEEDPYYFVAMTLAWQLNRWLGWRSEVRVSSGRYGSAVSDQVVTRGVTALDLTF